MGFPQFSSHSVPWEGAGTSDRASNVLGTGMFVLLSSQLKCEIFVLTLKNMLLQFLKNTQGIQAESKTIILPVAEIKPRLL